MSSTFLADRQFIHVGGETAGEFLQNLITCDVLDLPAGVARIGALLTPQGKILFDFLISKTEAGFLIETDTSSVDALLKRLIMYRLRAPIELTKLDETGVTLTWDETAPVNAAEDERFSKAGTKLYRALGKQSDASDDYSAFRIANVITESGVDFALQDAFPHDVLMDVNGGISFKKGCFVGQEVVSRMKHRGTARRRVVQIIGESPLPASGTEIMAGSKPIGTLGTVSGTNALGIIRIDRLADALASDVPVSVGGVLITANLPVWSGIELPASDATSTSET
jgi:folate-binding protein YgfZ